MWSGSRWSSLDSADTHIWYEVIKSGTDLDFVTQTSCTKSRSVPDPDLCTVCNCVLCVKAAYTFNTTFQGSGTEVLSGIERVRGFYAKDTVHTVHRSGSGTDLDFVQLVCVTKSRSVPDLMISYHMCVSALVKTTCCQTTCLVSSYRNDFLKT